MSRVLIVVAFAGVAACGGGNNAGQPDAPDEIDAAIDAPKAGPCWPVEGTTPGGTVQLGGGEGAFVPMGDEINVVYGSQSGFHIPVHARMTGMVPGNPTNVLDPMNPRTRFRAFFVDTGEPLNEGACPVRLAYQPATGAEFDLLRDSAVLFQVGLPEDEIFGREVRVVVELIDATGKYATEEKIVTCRAPPGWMGPPG
jgi:hypothetical protein